MIKVLVYDAQYQGVTVCDHILLKISVLNNKLMAPCLEIFWAYL
jgi:hypothetical protein